MDLQKASAGVSEPSLTFPSVLGRISWTSPPSGSLGRDELFYKRHKTSNRDDGSEVAGEPPWCLTRCSGSGGLSWPSLPGVNRSSVFLPGHEEDKDAVEGRHVADGLLRLLFIPAES